MKIVIIVFSVVFVISVAKAAELIPQDCIGKACIKEADTESEEYLKKVLSAMDLAFAVKNTENGTWIIWESESKEQEQEVMNRVSQYFFLKDVCKELPLPSPDQPAKPELSCKQ
jgi:hypothetical protein